MYAKIENDVFIKWVNLREEYPHISFPAEITEQDLPEGVVLVDTSPLYVALSPLQVIEPDPIPTLHNGRWTLLATPRAMTPSEAELATQRKASEIRHERNRRLMETDWRFRSDLNPSLEWRQYCQSLRDLTEQVGFPWDTKWPTPPSE